MLEKARKYFEIGKTLHSIQIYHKLINEYPNFVEPYVELAFVYSKLGKESSAEKILRQAYEIEPENEEVIYMLGNVSLRLKRFDEAIKFLSKLAHLRYPVVHYNLGLAYYYKGDYLSAEAEFKEVLKIDPGFPKVVETLAEILIKRESYDEAYEYLQKALRKEPYNSTLYYLISISLWNLGKLYEAKKAIETAIDIEPEKAIFWEMCGRISLELGQIDEAERYFNRAIELDRNLADSFISLGLIYAYRGKIEDANRLFEEAMRIDPGSRIKIEEKLKVLKNG
jgi:tetratricopeptide (TPR) repeat protein